jgi:hypothetical protein
LYIKRASGGSSAAVEFIPNVAEGDTPLILSISRDDGFETIFRGRPSVITNYIKPNGSGLLGQGGISWDYNGNFTVNAKFLKALMDSGAFPTDDVFELYREDANGNEIGNIGFYGTTSPYVQIRSYEAANHVDAYFRCAGANATMKATGVARIDGYTITSSTTIVADSDERLKDIVDEAKGNIEKIASVRVVNFSYKSDDTKSLHLGTIAQDWQDIYPNAVKENAEGFLGLDYPAIAVAASVENAKEVVKLREENEELKKRLAAIEKKLGI